MTPSGPDGTAPRHRVFPHPKELNRLPGHGPDRQHSASARITLDLCQDDPGETDLLIELAGHIDGILAGHGIGHQEHLVGVHGLLHCHKFGHQFIIDVQPAAGIQHNEVVPLLLATLYPTLADSHDVGT